MNAVQVVVLSHEHGEDILVCANMNAAYKAAKDLMIGTVDDLEDPSDIESLIKAGKIEQAMNAYNKAYELEVDPSEQHTIYIRQCKIIEG